MRFRPVLVRRLLLQGAAVADEGRRVTAVVPDASPGLLLSSFLLGVGHSAPCRARRNGTGSSARELSPSRTAVGGQSISYGTAGGSTFGRRLHAWRRRAGGGTRLRGASAPRAARRPGGRRESESAPARLPSVARLEIAGVHLRASLPARSFRPLSQACTSASQAQAPAACAAQREPRVEIVPGRRCSPPASGYRAPSTMRSWPSASATTMPASSPASWALRPPRQACSRSRARSCRVPTIAIQDTFERVPAPPGTRVRIWGGGSFRHSPGPRPDPRPRAPPSRVRAVGLGRGPRPHGSGGGRARGGAHQVMPEIVSVCVRAVRRVLPSSHPWPVGTPRGWCRAHVRDMCRRQWPAAWPRDESLGCSTAERCQVSDGARARPVPRRASIAHYQQRDVVLPRRDLRTA